MLSLSVGAALFSCAGAGSGGFPGIEGPVEGKVVAEITWDISTEAFAHLTPESKQELENAGFRFEGNKLISPHMGLAGRWIKVGQAWAMTDLNGVFRLDSLPEGIAQAHIYKELYDQQAEGSFTTSHIVPQGSAPNPYVLKFGVADPGEMNPEGLELCQAATTETGCPTRNTTNCSPGNNSGGCCLDYNGPFGDGQAYFRNLSSPICAALGARNFVRSTCFNWSFNVINSEETEGGTDCINEAAFTETGPSCWRNHKYRNCQNLNRKDFFVNDSEKGVTLEVDPGESISFTVRNNTPQNGTALVPEDVEMPGEFSVTKGDIYWDEEGFFIIEHFNDDTKQHFENQVVTYTAPATLPGGATSASYKLTAMAFGWEIPITINVGGLVGCEPPFVKIIIEETPGQTYNEYTGSTSITQSGNYATATVELGSISLEAWAGNDKVTGHFSDHIQFDAPGMTGQPVTGNAVIRITHTKTGPQEITYWTVTGGLGLFNALSASGGPPPSSSTFTIPLNSNFRFGRAGPAQLWGRLGVIWQEGTRTTLKVEFIRFEDLPPGTTVRSCSSSNWINGSP